ncbi:receptor activity-modifying protein 1-like, partial [Huso huso]
MTPTSRLYRLLRGLLLLPALCAACDLTLYSSSIQHCVTNFEVQMNWTDPQRWCDWTVLSSLYNDLTVCTEMLADALQCEWPNPEVDSLFVGVHGCWLKACPRYIAPLRDPPPLCARASHPGSCPLHSPGHCSHHLAGQAERGNAV